MGPVTCQKSYVTNVGQHFLVFLSHLALIGFQGHEVT
jgi:hypothetical protein